MRRLLPLTSALFLCLATVHCTPEADPAADNEEIAVLKKRITKLENRVRKLEGRNRKGPPGKRPPNKGPLQVVQAKGDATTLVLMQKERRVKLPAKLPAGTYGVLATFGNDAPAKRGQVVIPKLAEGAKPEVVFVNCPKAQESCTVEKNP